MAELKDGGIITKELKLYKGQAIAFDFDGVIHKYSKGWGDGSIYDAPNENALDIIKMLIHMKVPVFILSTRSAQQIVKWWNEQDFGLKCEVIPDDVLFWKDLSVIGVTNRKLPAQIYVDDRAYKYTGQDVPKFIKDFM